jgi:hypothetical protein
MSATDSAMQCNTLLLLFGLLLVDWWWLLQAITLNAIHIPSQQSIQQQAFFKQKRQLLQRQQKQP